MDETGTSLLTYLVFSPLIGALLLLFCPSSEKGGRNFLTFVAFTASLLPLLLTLAVLAGFNSGDGSFQLVEKFTWIESLGVSYILGVDGISLALIALTTLTVPIIILASHSITSKLRGYLINMLVLECAMIGTFAALDLFLFYIFWELMLVPMYFIIGIWGGKRRVYATLKFVLYTVVGSLLMLVAIIYSVWSVWSSSGVLSFAFVDLMRNLQLSFDKELWLFAAVALAFAIKIPLFPLHTWLPDAHVEAPTGGSVILAGVLLKMGLYGLLRFAYPLFPHAADYFAPLLALLAVIGIVYGALVAWAQTDIKKLVAYSSVSHLGYCVLGLVALNSLATTGSVVQMINHGISTGALFLLVGVLYDRRHTREISEYGGLASKVPLFAFLFIVFTMSSIALPLTNGFIGEFMILSGAFQKYPILTAVAVSGVVLGAVYMLSLCLRTIFGEIDLEKNGDLQDLTGRELATLAPFLVLVFVIGIFPQPLIHFLEPSVKQFISVIEDRRESLPRGLIGEGEDGSEVGAMQVSWRPDAKQ